jgi:SAM-dependent methyltransferase
MHLPKFEYHGLMAATWDLFRGDTSGWADRAFYRQIIAHHGQPVLDVGCGTGRLLLDYLADGIDIEGVDNSPEMLQLCQQKAQQRELHPVLYCQPMEALELPRSYRTILVPSSSFQLLTDQQQAQEAMRHFFSHLDPSGVLVMPFMRLWQEGDPLETDWQLTGEQVQPEDGALMRRWSRSRFDPADDCEHTLDRYEVIRDEKVIAQELHQRSPATRSYTQAQAMALYAEAGFVSLQAYHEFSFEPAQPTDSLVTILGKHS